jgi:hypothetical protein
MTSMTPDWTTVASRCVSVPQLMRTGGRSSRIGSSSAFSSLAAVGFVQKCPTLVAEPPHSEVTLSINSVPTNCATYGWYGIRLARPTLMNFYRHRTNHPVEFTFNADQCRNFTSIVTL